MVDPEVPVSLPRALCALSLLATACRDDAAPTARDVAAVPAAVPTSATRSRATTPHAGQQQGLASPDGGLSVRVPIVAMQGRDFATYWCPEITALDGTVRFQDSVCFPARFNVYWGWDAQQRLWVYNSDDGRVWIYAEGPEGWDRQAWERDGELEPPAELRAKLSDAP